MDVRDETQKRLRDWIAALPELTGWSLTRLAREAGLSTTTLTKPVNNPDHPHVTSSVTIAKLSRATGVPPPAGYDDGTAPRGFAEAEAQPFAFDAAPDMNTLIRGFIGGRPGVDAWKLKTRALELFGYLPGDIVILDLNAAWLPGDTVCAQLYNHDTGRAETIWRRYEPPYLLAGSADRAFLRPISEDAVARKGAVLTLFRPRAPAA